MPFPSLSLPHELPPVLRMELEQFISLLQGYLSAQHDENGAHTDLTADSIVVGTLGLTGRLAPAQITANQNDYAISDTARAFIFSDAARSITGITAGFDGQLLWVTNYGGFAITLKNNDTASAVGNRIMGAAATDVVLRANNGSALLLYDAASFLWYALGA